LKDGLALIHPWLPVSIPEKFMQQKPNSEQIVQSKRNDQTQNES